MTIVVFLISGFLICMGIASLASPAFTAGFFAFNPESPESRNEIRAVYGGFGIALGALLVYVDLSAEAPRTGVYLTVAAAFGGMAAGRLISWCFERVAGWPLLFFCLEVIAAGSLAASIPLPGDV